VLVDRSVEFQVEAILKHRMVRARPTKNHGKKAVKAPNKEVIQYYTKFLGYGPEFCEWLREEDFTNDGKCRNSILESYKNKLVNQANTSNVSRALRREKRRGDALREQIKSLELSLAQPARKKARKANTNDVAS
jgi:hypothetical protein